MIPSIPGDQILGKPAMYIHGNNCNIALPLSSLGSIMHYVVKTILMTAATAFSVCTIRHEYP